MNEDEENYKEFTTLYFWSGYYIFIIMFINNMVWWPKIHKHVLFWPLHKQILDW